jgi:hypothetical protein
MPLTWKYLVTAGPGVGLGGVLTIYGLVVQWLTAAAVAKGRPVGDQRHPRQDRRSPRRWPRRSVSRASPGVSASVSESVTRSARGVPPVC